MIMNLTSARGGLSIKGDRSVGSPWRSQKERSDLKIKKRKCAIVSRLGLQIDTVDRDILLLYCCHFIHTG